MSSMINLSNATDPRWIFLLSLLPSAMKHSLTCFFSRLRMTKLTLLTALLLATQATAFAPPASSARSPTAVSMQKEAVTRRSWLANTGAIFSSAVFLPRPALADSKLTPYQDGVLGYQISAPASWDKSEQQLADRRFLTLFMDPTSGADKTLMFIAKTPIQPDFTSLGSFGSVDQVSRQALDRTSQWIIGSASHSIPIFAGGPDDDSS